MTARTPFTNPITLLRLEGGLALAAALALYAHQGGNWLLLALLALAPDLSIIGYRAGNTIGATCYNAAHSYMLPAALGTYGLK